MVNIVFVDKNDVVIGAGSKSDAKGKGIIHRIIRIIVFNSQGEILIQKRSAHVSVPNKWDQSVGGHVDEGEDYAMAALREAQEEIGADKLDLEPIEKYYTESNVEGHTLKRFNMLYRATYDGKVTFNERETSEVRWVRPDELSEWMEHEPEVFTSGFIHAYQLLLKSAKS